MMKYVQIKNGVVDAICLSPRSGWTQVHDDVFAGYSIQEDGSFSAPAKPAPSTADVNTERDRRIEAGSTFTVTGAGNIPVTGRNFDMIVLSQKRFEADAKKAAGSTAADIIFRDKANTTHSLTPDQMISLVNQGQAWVQATMEVSWAMKDGTGDFTSGIPADYADDKYWP